MNSKLLWFYLINTGTVLANGYFRYKPAYLKNFPIPIIDIINQKKIENLVNEIVIINKKGNNSKTQEITNELDNLIYMLYDLNNSEIDIINNIIK